MWTADHLLLSEGLRYRVSWIDPKSKPCWMRVIDKNLNVVQQRSIFWIVSVNCSLQPLISRVLLCDALSQEMPGGSALMASYSWRIPGSESNHFTQNMVIFFPLNSQMKVLNSRNQQTWKALLSHFTFIYLWHLFIHFGRPDAPPVNKLYLNSDSFPSGYINMISFKMYLLLLISFM